jgi:phosphoribosyl-ATP pyrophosphohydrolase
MIDATVLLRLAQTIEERKGAEPGSSYVAGLFHHGEDAILRKVGEEAVEVMLASKSGDRLHLVRELADLWFHTLVLLAHHGLGPADVLHELRRREGISGLDEKASRSKDS